MISDLQRVVLDIERQWWRDEGRKDGAILTRTGLSPTRYYALVNRMLDDPEVLAADPQLVGRLRRVRDARRARRVAA